MKAKSESQTEKEVRSRVRTTLRISFDLTDDDAEMIMNVRDRYGDPKPTWGQLGKILLIERLRQDGLQVGANVNRAVK